jgi:hypothetical protein
MRDAPILVDVLRGYQPAEYWLVTQAPIPQPLATRGTTKATPTSPLGHVGRVRGFIGI